MCPLKKIDDFISKNQNLAKYKNKLVSVEIERVSSVSLYLGMLTDCKDNKKILNLYYDDLYKFISTIQISVIVTSTLTGFFQGIDTEEFLPDNFIKLFSLCSSTYISLVLSLSKFFRLDEKKEAINNLTEKYCKIHNKIRFLLDNLKPWKDSWYIDESKIESKLKEWDEFKKKLDTEYKSLIVTKQELYTDYENIMQSDKRINKYKNIIIKNKKNNDDYNSEFLSDDDKEFIKYNSEESLNSQESESIHKYYSNKGRNNSITKTTKEKEITTEIIKDKPLDVNKNGVELETYLGYNNLKINNSEIDLINNINSRNNIENNYNNDLDNKNNMSENFNILISDAIDSEESNQYRKTSTSVL